MSITTIEPGAVVRVTATREGYDATEGDQYVVLNRSEDENGPYYILDGVPGAAMFGEFYAHPEDVAFVRSAEEQRRRMQMPSKEDFLRLVSQGLISAYHSDLSVFETEILMRDDESPEHSEPFEEPNDFPFGVVFYGRRPGGVSFGCTLRLTGLWYTDD